MFANFLSANFLSIFFSFFLSISLHVFFYLFIFPHIHLSVCLSACQYLYLTIYLSFFSVCHPLFISIPLCFEGKLMTIQGKNISFKYWSQSWTFPYIMLKAFGISKLWPGISTRILNLLFFHKCKVKEGKQEKGPRK